MVNKLNKKEGGRVAIKVDISQAYDTMSWDFLQAVMDRFGFSQRWINMIMAILKFVKLSILVNGGPEGFISMERGLRQGDPLSPLLFALAEDSLSRGLNKLWDLGLAAPFTKAKGVPCPSHLLYVEDVFIFSSGDGNNIRNIVRLLERYQSSSGQITNKDKSKLLAGGMH
ncbi:hypothetical protein IFM89_027044 [Coptis chinensis]|uniref:Reverse transcriptase domain-containing protein n=1 Tax=Coptis chinensis TaxID=261450 RepID=A0A835LXB4_9MAGN|nr:hypothetical protein IFM89_027044 [Coptis chinensis]